MILDKIAKIAPKGHRYLQKNLSMKKFPIAIAINRINPILSVGNTGGKTINFAKEFQGFTS
ncbi:MAG: hypothetical protein ACRCYE_15150 [Sarcina sp.]